MPETYLVVLDRERLVIETNASDITSVGGLRTLQPTDIDRLLANVERRPDGKVPGRCAARVRGCAVPDRPFSGLRDTQRRSQRRGGHEHRRDLRGLYVFSAWLNHTRMDPLHTMDVVVHPEGQAPHVRHYLLDFMSTLGSAGTTGPKAVWEGRDPVYGRGAAIRNMAGLGIYTPAWMRAKYPDLPAVGAFESATFDPDRWTTMYDSRRSPTGCRTIRSGPRGR